MIDVFSLEHATEYVQLWMQLANVQLESDMEDDINTPDDCIDLQGAIYQGHFH
jgi:hypothetical protein